MPETVVQEDVLPSVAAGESMAVERCLDRYGGLVWSLAKRYFERQADAEDAVQEAFLSLWENAYRFDSSVGSESTFVAMICRRRIIDSVRKTSRSSKFTSQPRLDEPTTEVEAVADIQTNTVEYDGVQLQGFEITEEAAHARRLMKDLRREEQQVIDMAVCQGLSQSRIAEITGWPLGTVKSHARRGMQRLRELLTINPHRNRSTEAAREAKQ